LRPDLLGNDRLPGVPVYRHHRHAGNFADIHKHAVLAWLVRALTRAREALCVLDTHAGDGLYRLDDARRRANLASLRSDAGAPAALAPYLHVLGTLNRPSSLDVYPGSPWLVRTLMGPGDALFLAESHPRAVAALSARFRDDPRVRVLERDGWEVLGQWRPAGSSRGLVLVDPPYTDARDYGFAADALIDAARRRPHACYRLWYPWVDGNHEPMLKTLCSAFAGSALRAELWVEPPGRPGAMTGSGLFVVHPPAGLHEALEHLQPWLQARLARAPGGGVRLVPAART
jgi:23S rRNA (adenine2030-N6)-methyltransferase